MLRKLLFSHQEKNQLIIAMIGSFLGITFLVTAIHYLIKVNEFGEGSEILGPNTLIIQKKVSNANTLGVAKTDFSEAEIEAMKKESFILDVKPVVSNNFDISFQTDDKLVPYFRTDVFVQSVDEGFLDVKSTKWKWKVTDSIVPIILPREFIVMMNTFMSSSGIPQISDDLAKEIKFKFALKNEHQKEYVNARIIGFTNEVSAILVPESFMKYGNEKFGDSSTKKITQLMLSGKESEFGLVEIFLEKRHLESKNAQVVVGRLKSVVGTLILVILGVAIITVFLSGLVLIQYAQLLLSRNAYEVRTLMRIGYAPAQLIQHFFLYFVKIFGIIAVLGVAIFFCLKFYLDRLFIEGGLYIDTNLTISSFLALLLAYVVFAIASYFNVKKGVYREF